MKLLLLLVVCCAFPAVVLGCSDLCVEGSPTRPPVTVIRDAFREENNANIYSAIVIGAVCNCVDLPVDVLYDFVEDTDVTIHCRAYSLQEDGVVATSLVSRGVCDSVPYSIRACVNTESGLTSGLNLVADINASVPLLTDLKINTEFGDCDLSCPFNNDVPPDFLDYGFGYRPEIQPCYYIVRVTEVFKGSFTNGTLLNVTGPVVLTSCLSSGHNLQIGEEYVVGIGGRCSSIREWTLLSNYNVDLLRDPEAGRNSLLALLVILPSLIVAVSLAVTGCVYYRRRRGARKKAPQSSDDGRKLSEEAEQGDPD